MTTSSGQVISRDEPSQRGRLALVEATACQGPFDSDGFPIALSKEVDKLKRAITKAEKRNLDPNLDAKVKAAIIELVDKMPFGDEYEALGEDVQSLYLQSQSMSISERLKKAQKIQAAFLKLMNNQCFTRFRKALTNKGIVDIPF